MKLKIALRYYAVGCDQTCLAPRAMSSIPSNLKGCQILAGGKAEGRNPRNAFGNKFDPGRVVKSAGSFISGTLARVPAPFQRRLPYYAIRTLTRNLFLACRGHLDTASHSRTGSPKVSIRK